MTPRLFPQENRSLELLADMAVCVVDATEAVSRTMGSPQADHEQALEAAMEIEGRSTDQFFALMTSVRSSYVTPLPRTDLYLLGRRLHTTTQALTSASHVIRVHGLHDFSTRASDVLDIIQRQATLTREAMRHLNDLEGLDEYWIEVQRMHKQATRTLDLYTADLIDRLKAGAYLKKAQFTDKLERASRSMGDLATEVGRILVQES